MKKPFFQWTVAEDLLTSMGGQRQANSESKQQNPYVHTILLFITRLFTHELHGKKT